ncbi:MAG: aminotransferase class V-fold PLP-dependent enzyme [Lachnospiraceae bacterium]|nr:aminotransferase class V-fold PLP-dependent enzyme [Lachnospiraceae bacterium]
MIYLDSSATSFLKPPQVEEAVCKSFHTIGNAGRGAHAPTLSASRLIYDAREKLADLFHIADPSRVSFTCNATEALNIAIGALIHSGDHVVTTACEHNSVLRPLYRKEEEGVKLTILPADKKGRISYEKLAKSGQENTKAVVITHASNLTGNVTDLAKVSAFTRKRGILLIVDASQTAGTLPIDVEKMGIDALCFTGHKGLLGPQGTGGVYIRKGLTAEPFKVGGSGNHSFDRKHPSDMPAALEAGTANGHGLAGLNAALDFLKETGVEAIYQKEDALARRFAQGVSQVRTVALYGDLEAKIRAPIVSLNINGMDSAVVSDILWEDYKICVRSGAHCAPLMHQALGTVEQGAVRFSFSYFNTEEEVDEAIRAVQEIAGDNVWPGYF